MDTQQRDEYYAAIVKDEEAGSWDKVADACLKIAELDLPDLEKSIGWMNAGRAYGHLKNLERALYCYDRAIQLESRHNRSFALVQKAAFLSEQGRLRESLAIFRDLLARQDLYLADIQRYTKNIELLEQALKNSNG